MAESLSSDPTFLLRATDVAFRYRRRSRSVVQSINLSIEQGSTVLVGPNGAGKSTLLKLLAKQLKPTRGLVQSVVRIGYAPQRPVLLSAFTVKEQVEYAGWLAGLTRGETVQKTMQALNQVDLRELQRRLAPSLSGGESARLGIACALVAEPRVLLLDEPTAALDPIARERIRGALVRVHSEGVTVVVTSHTAADIGAPFSRLITMDQGSIVYDGDIDEFFAKQHTNQTANDLARALRGN